MKNHSKKTKVNVDNFIQTLSPEYYDKGVFNLPVKVHNFIPEASCDVTISFSNTGEKIIGRYTKSGKTNKINGYIDLVNWYSRYVSKSKKVHIQIIAPTHYRLSIPS